MRPAREGRLAAATTRPSGRATTGERPHSGAPRGRHHPTIASSGASRSPDRGTCARQSSGSSTHTPCGLRPDARTPARRREHWRDSRSPERTACGQRGSPVRERRDPRQAGSTRTIAVPTRVRPPTMAMSRRSPATPRWARRPARSVAARCWTATSTSDSCATRWSVHLLQRNEIIHRGRGLTAGEVASRAPAAESPAQAQGGCRRRSRSGCCPRSGPPRRGRRRRALPAEAEAPVERESFPPTDAPTRCGPVEGGPGTRNSAGDGRGASSPSGPVRRGWWCRCHRRG